MTNVKVQLRLPEELREAVLRQAAQAGVSMNLYLATAIAARVGAQAEADRYLSGRGARTTPARAKAILMRLGDASEPRHEDRLDADTTD